MDQWLVGNILLTAAEGCNKEEYDFLVPKKMVEKDFLVCFHLVVVIFLNLPQGKDFSCSLK